MGEISVRVRRDLRALVFALLAALEMKLAKTGRVPPTDGVGHWRFPVADGVMLRAKGYDQLFDLIFQYRLRANMEIGDIERDIDRYYCDRYPSFCHAEASDTDPTMARASSEPMLNRVSRWVATAVHRMPRGGYALVTGAEAERRAAICAQCPKQDSGWRGGCGACSASVLALLQQVRSLRRTSRDGNLGACLIGGWENGASVHLPVEALGIPDYDKARMPAACWRKATA